MFEEFIRQENITDLHIFLTFNCNKRCSFCYQENYNKEVLSIDKLNFYLKEFEKIKFIPNKIIFNGGEPSLLRDKFLDYLYLINEQYPNVYKSINTNFTGSIEFYNKIIINGINNISINTDKIDYWKLKKIIKNKLSTYRINHVINDIKKCKKIFKMALRNKIGLTLLNNFKEDKINDIEKLLKIKNYIKKSFFIYIKYMNKSYYFYSCSLNKSGRINSFSILPNGDYTNKFDVIKKGGIK